jgi:UDP-N-acetyl-D-glucosamine dehydrogenase
MNLLGKIANKSAHVVVMGVGYVGLPLVAEFARAGFRVTGLDKDARKVESLRRGVSYIDDVPTSDIAPHVRSGRLDATVDCGVLAHADAVVVCVPTPLNKTKDPDMQFILAATEDLARHQHEDMVIVLESTTYPGTTSEVLVPQLTKGGFTVGKDVFIAFSPERVDPGNEVYKTKNTPKVIGGATRHCLEVAQTLYSKIIDHVVPVSSTETAEMVKLLENTFRAVNIGLVNEVAIMSRRLGIDPFEVIRAAATKPFGFMPFYPGPGLGGHCIPIDPLYLSWKLRSLKYDARFIELADSINSAMPGYVVERITTALNDVKKPVNGSRILVYGVAYKANVSDLRESPALIILHELNKLGAELAYMDPFIPLVNEDGISLEATHPDRGFSDYDLVVLVTNHAALDKVRLMREAKLIVDTRDALFGVPGERSKVYGL